jgi:hypothetical protein
MGNINISTARTKAYAKKTTNNDQRTLSKTKPNKPNLVVAEPRAKPDPPVPIRVLLPIYQN